MTKWTITPGQPISRVVRKTWLKAVQEYPFMPRDSRQIYVPAGWLPAMHDMAGSLADAIAGHPDADNFHVRSVRSLGQDNPYIDVTHYDRPAIIGIIRKTQARCRHTCTLCGFIGKYYELEKLENHLCVDCVAPALLLEALEINEQNLAMSLSNSPIHVSQVPTELRQSLRHWMNIEDQERDTLQVAEQWDIREWTHSLRSIHRMLKKQQQGREALWSKSG